MLQRRAKRFNRREAMAGYLFISPWIVGFWSSRSARCCTASSSRSATTTWPRTGAQPAASTTTPSLFEDPKVALSLGNTLFYAVMAVPLEIVVALVLALLLNSLGRGAGVFRTSSTCRR